jgi:hypothetical protein
MCDDDIRVTTPPTLYTIRVKGRLGPTALSAFPEMVAEVHGGETVLTGPLEDSSAVFGVIGQIEAMGLVLIELRQIRRSSDVDPWTRPIRAAGSSSRSSASHR